jgi:hypothetical protein
MSIFIWNTFMLDRQGAMFAASGFASSQLFPPLLQ